MPSELSVHVRHEGGMRMSASNGVHTVTTDYPLIPGADAAGLRPLELLLASLGACGGSALALLLQRAGQPVRGVDVDARGQRRDEHPTIFTAITLTFVVRGAGVDPAVVAATLAQCEERLCPVWAIVGAGTPVTATFRVVPD